MVAIAPLDAALGASVEGIDLAIPRCVDASLDGGAL
jgi:hypothetical protein